MEITASIRGITYQPTLCKPLPEHEISHLQLALRESACICLLDATHVIAVSCWVSPKRTRSYPYARIYDTLGFGGRKATIIPIVKDEGSEGDRDFLQWDTVALMGLLGVYVIPAYYSNAERSPRYQNKITNQQFDEAFITEQLRTLQYYHSSALHWNIEQFDRLQDVGQLALESYDRISRSLNVRLHSPDGLHSWLQRVRTDRELFLEESRARSRAAQQREIRTVQPREYFEGTKGSITIHDHVGGLYPLTADHCAIDGNCLRITESKHSKSNALPSAEDIKDGLLKMSLFCNLTRAEVDGKQFSCAPVLRLACDPRFRSLTAAQRGLLDRVTQEATLNSFDLDLTGLPITQPER